MKNRGIRIDDKTWLALKKMAKPETISILIRRVLRDFVEKSGKDSK